MTLKLVMIRCPDNVAPEQRTVRGGEFSIGRGPDNEWIIADPERHLSKRHCRFAFRSGGWEITDLSSNGTFLNGAGTPIGHDVTQILRDGDRIAFGAYELEVTITEDGASLDRGAPVGGFAPRAADPLDPFASEPSYAAHAGLGRPGDVRLPEADLGLGGDESPILPPDFDPLAPPEEPFSGPVQPDHAPALESAFRPPPPVSLIPDDWDANLSLAPRPNAPSSPAAKAAEPLAAAVPLPVSNAPPTMSDSALVAAFLRGAGLGDVALTDPEKTMERVGAAMRAVASGVRQTLIARAKVKDTFRIEQTMIQATGNNPLKFSIDDDDALTSLLGLGRRGNLAADVAITEALVDIRMHELATTTAMQTAVRRLLEQFDPGAIERSAEGGLNILPAQRKARAWDAFTHLHHTVTQALSDNFDSVFGKAFARAYEQAIDELTAREPTP